MKRWWKASWDKQSGRIDALNLRERVFLFLSVLACCMALVDTLWLSPAQTAHRQLTQRFEKQNAELQRVRETLKGVATPANNSKALRAEVTAVKSRLDKVNLSMKEVMPQASRATPLAQVLVPLLRRHEGLTLVRTVTLAADVTMTNKNAATAAPNAAVPGVSVKRQGVELTVSGSYTELTRYLQTLEQALPYVRWGDMKLKSDKLPPELTLQLFLVGVQP